MDFDLNAEQRAVRDAFARFVDERVAPQAAALDEAHAFPRAPFDELARLGLFAMRYPEDVGGSGAGLVEFCLALQEIAREVGMNPNALQSHFRRSYGTTVIAFMRESRLQRARLALERDGVSIKRAAALAGYTSAANFATAFGRQFGITPTQARRAMQR